MKKYVSILFTMFLVFAVYGQSAGVIDQILETDKATFGQVCYLSAVEQGLINEDADFNEAILALADQGQIPSIVNEDTVAPVVDIAFIMSQMWDIKGGLFYILTKGSPRYTFKQFKSDGVIDSSVDPNDVITGAELLSMYTVGIKVYGGFDISAVSMENE